MSELFAIEIVVNGQGTLRLPFDLFPSLTVDTLSDVVAEAPSSNVSFFWIDNHGNALPIESTHDLQDAAQAQIDLGAYTLRFHASVSGAMETDPEHINLDPMSLSIAQDGHATAAPEEPRKRQRVDVSVSPIKP